MSVLVVISAAAAGGVADARPARKKPAATPAAPEIVTDAPSCAANLRALDAVEKSRAVEAMKHSAESLAAWREIAETLTTTAHDTTVFIDVRRDCAYAAIRALRHSLHVVPRREEPWDRLVEKKKPAAPVIDADEQRMLDALDTFLALAPAERSDRAAGVRFLRGNIRRRHDQLDVAHDDFAFVATHHRETEVGLYAVNLLLDGLVLQKRYDEMIVWVWRLRTDEDLMARDEDLADRLRMIEHRWWELGAQRAGRPVPTEGDIDVLHLAALPLTLLHDVGGIAARAVPFARESRR